VENNRRLGLNDSHLHLIRGGLNYNLELRWEGVPSLAIALEMLKRQAENIPAAPQWVRVVGGWSEFQFAERRMPTDIMNYGDGDEFLRMNGTGENLTWSAADFENFLEPHPDLEPVMEGELESIVRLLVEKNGLRFIIDHAETISTRNIERIKALGGGIAIEHRMAFQGEYFIDRYGAEAAKRTPPVKEMLKLGVPVGAGTDATRVASYNPFISLYWLITGKTLGGVSLYDESDLLDRETALYLYTKVLW